MAKKSLGQHFLTSTSVLSKIIDAADVQDGETILEIGPGTGVLSQALWDEILIDNHARLIMVETDEDMLNILEKKFEDELEYDGRMHLIAGDILDDGLLEKYHRVLVSGKFSVIANIPYYITGAILEKFLEHGPRPKKMVLLVQKEVAERIVAKDGKESVLSISVKAFGEPSLVARVPKGAFTPPPTVESAVLSIKNISDRRFTESGVDILRFFKVLKAGFLHKRKFLKRNLESVLSEEEINTKWRELRLDDKVRAEDLKIDSWIQLGR
jgi:16S rRNA (adenine1518-N6/adenine1519-N6)-dimethyltransferase